ncbi:MAG: L,D-transpeptidase family protein [Limimaricola sp.]|nr:L,D-transpeptidase family protein [Limimaricola sp.]
MTMNRRELMAGLAAGTVVVPFATSASAQVPAFMQGVAQAASQDEDLAAFYRARNFEGIWSGTDRAAQERRNALLAAFAIAPDHGLPAARYDPQALIGRIRAATQPIDQGMMEVELSRLFLQFARDIQTGILTPGQIDDGLKLQVPYRARLGTLQAFAQSTPAAFLRSLPPSSPEYGRLLREKAIMERMLAAGGYGPTVPGGKLEPGASGPAVVALRNRLITMGFLDRSVSQDYDAALQAAVQRYQAANGLSTDGVAGQGTLDEINRPLEARLASVIVALERERWMNSPRGARHIWVNIPDFTARIVDNDNVTFECRAVVGQTSVDHQTPEFSDVMEFMIINPSWYVPRSIIVKEYLPQLQANPFAASNLQITDAYGRVVDRSTADFNAYTQSNFPFSMREPPSQGNALGRVKFLFPNPYNIYLHDTPSKSLFNREVRAFSHGCVRLGDPFDFAYTLLARQEADPQAVFKAGLDTGVETRVDLVDPVPVHLTYRTAFTNVTGGVQFRRDIYRRDRDIWNALAQAGVAVRAIAA